MFAWFKDRSPEPAPRLTADEAKAGQISFRCMVDDLGVIAPPVPAKHVMPDWFKRLPAVAREAIAANNNAITVKRCMPFIDAMSFGWIIPLAATVRLEIKDGGANIECGWDFDKEMVSPHSVAQVEGHPRLPAPPMKFHNYWTISTPPGWSCLFIPPLNRPNPLFEAAAGVVDTDKYQSLIHFPFFALAADGVHVVEKGTPIVQVIPFRRDLSALAMTADIRAETQDEADERERIRRSTMAGAGWYREQARAPR